MVVIVHVKDIGAVTGRGGHGRKRTASGRAGTCWRPVGLEYL